MLKISLENNILTISDDSGFFYNDDYNSFFVDELGFKEEKNTRVFDGDINSELISNIYQYLMETGVEIVSNDKIENLLNKVRQKEASFQNLTKTGLKIKKTKFPSFKEIQKGVSLNDYQIIPTAHAIELGSSANFSVPGSGKTWMAYLAYTELKKRGEVNRLLVISPLSAFRPWENEYLNIFGRKPRVHRIKSNKISFLRNHLSKSEIFLVSYTTASLYPAFLTEIMEEANFMLICDESHYIKNPRSQRSIAMHEIAPFAKKRMILTGTPMPLGTNDLWSQFTFLFPDENLLGDFEYYKYQIKVNGFAPTKQMLKPYYTRVTLGDLKLPKPIFQRKQVKMSPLQRDIYDAIAGTIFAKYKSRVSEYDELDEWRTNMTIYLLEAAVDPSLLTKEKGMKKLNPNEILDFKKMSFADLIRNYKRSKETPAKIEKAVNEVINVVDKKEKVVVWASFVRTIQRMQDELKKRGYDSFTVTGKVPQDEEADPNDNREKRIEDFKTTDTNVLVANPASCAESISLHKHCQKALYLDRNFNGAQYMQSLARIHRVGMGKIHPKYLMLLSEDSIDEDVDIRLTFKHEQMLNFLNDDFPVLSLDLDNTSVFGLKNEQKADFEQYFKRIKKRQSRKR